MNLNVNVFVLKLNTKTKLYETQTRAFAMMICYDKNVYTIYITYDCSIF